MAPTGTTPVRMDFLTFEPNIIKTLADGSVKAIRGSLDHQQATVAEGMLSVKFRTKFWLTAAKMDVILLSLGFSQSTNTFTVSDSIPQTTFVVGPAGGNEFTFPGCIPSDWNVSGQKGQDPILLDVGWIGTSMAQASAGTFFVSQTSPAMTEGYPYAWATAGSGMANTVTLGSPFSETLLMPQIKLSVNNHLITESNNNIFVTNICPADREITVQGSVLYQSCSPSTLSLLTTPLGTWNGSSGTAADVSGCSFDWVLQRLAASNNNSTEFAIANVKLIARAPSIRKNEFNRLPIFMKGFATDAAASLIITNKNAEA